MTTAGAACGRDDLAYCEYRDGYRVMANALGFEGHIAWGSEME